MNTKSSINKSYSDTIFYIINALFLTIVLILALYPMIFIVSSSISERTAVIEGRVWLWPVGFSLDGYKAVFEDNRILNGYYNSAYYYPGKKVRHIDYCLDSFFIPLFIYFIQK